MGFVLVHRLLLKYIEMHPYSTYMPQPVGTVMEGWELGQQTCSPWRT